MEVEASEVERMEYRIPSADWKSEEKREHVDEQGRMWSAPHIEEGNPKKDEEVLVSRQYHRAGELLARNMTRAGEALGIRIPLAGEYKCGDSWADTH